MAHAARLHEWMLKIRNDATHWPPREMSNFNSNQSHKQFVGYSSIYEILLDSVFFFFFVGTIWAKARTHKDRNLICRNTNILQTLFIDSIV